MVYLILCILCTSILGLGFKYQEKLNLNIAHVVLVNYFYCGVYGLIRQSDELYQQETSTYLLASLLGLLFILGFNFFGLSISKNGVGLTTVFQKLSLVLTVLFALFLGESLNYIQFIGIMLSVLAIYLLFTKDKNKINSLNLDKKYLIAIFFLSTLIEICFVYINKQNISSVHPMNLTSLIFIFAFTFGFVYFVLNNQSSVISKGEFIAGIALGIPNFYSILFLNKALDSGMNGSLFFPLLNLSVILIASSIGIFYFRERFSRRQIFGYIFTALSILLIGFF